MDNHDCQYDKHQYQYLINHIIFPIKLPQKSESQTSEPEGECLILEFFDDILGELKLKTKSNGKRWFESAIDLFKSWRKIQTHQLNGKLIQKEIKLAIEASKITHQFCERKVPLYLKNQNVCLLFCIRPKEEVIFSYFQVSFENSELMSRIEDIESIYPNLSFQVNDLTILTSIEFCELLADLGNMISKDSVAKIIKSGGDEHQEMRNVPDISLIRDWLCYLLIGNRDLMNYPVKISKKMRDEVNFKENLPFRRSG